MLPKYRPLAEAPEPVAAFEAVIPVGVPPFKVTSFKASLIRDGAAWLQGNFEPFTVTAGDLVLMRPGTRCGSISIAPVDTVVLHVHPTFLVDQVRWTQPLDQRARRTTFEYLLDEIRRPVSINLPDADFLRIAELFSEVVFLSGHASAFRRMIARATELIWEIEEVLASERRESYWRRRSDPSLSFPVRDEVQVALQAMHQRYASELSIRELALEVSLSESALRRAILAATGFNPSEYLHRVRLMRFEELVAETTMPLVQAARLAGWASPSHARAMFVRSHGMSPSEFRAEAREARRADWRRSLGA